MTTEHVEPEALSAYLDGELDSAGQTAVERHLHGCAECAAMRSRLAEASGRLASLPEVSLTADEHRELRKAVLDSRRTRRVPWAGRYLQWAAAGGLVLVAVVAMSFGFLRNGPSGRDTSSEALRDAAAPSAQSFDFRNGDEVDRTVAALPEVAAGLNRYRPEDAPTGSSAARAEAGQSAGSGGGDGGTPTASEFLARTDEDTANSQGPAAAAAPAPEAAPDSAQAPDFSNEAADACLQAVASTQSYPMVGLLARQAAFEGTPAWLLVFAYSAEPEVGEPLDRWQTWLVRPEDCRSLSGPALESRVLYRSFSGQT